MAAPSAPRTVRESDGRPEIVIGSDQHRMVQQAVDALGRDPTIYQRSGELVHVVLRQDSIFGSDPETAVCKLPIIRKLRVETLGERLSAIIRWKKILAKGRAKDCEPPDKIVRKVDARGEWPTVRALRGVTATPMLRPDGTVLQGDGGYDLLSGMLYVPSCAYPIVDDEPSYADALVAKEHILSVFRQFCWLGPEHLSAWFAGMLSCLARPAFDGPAPFFMVDATTPGTGKTKLVKATGRIVLGNDFPIFQQADDEAEFRKRITSILKRGSPFILMDNLTKSLGGAAIESLFTSTQWGDRALGALELVEADNMAIWWGTANNVRFHGDMPRRTLRIRLETDRENPQDRDDFDEKDLIGHVMRERRKLVYHALTILRAWYVSNCPGSSDKPWGGFEGWSKIVPPIVRWLEMADPLKARADEDLELDTDKHNLFVILGAIKRLDPDKRGITVKTLLTMLFPEDGRFRDAGAPTLPGVTSGKADEFEAACDAIEEVTGGARSRRGTPDPTRFGKYLQRVRGRIAGGDKIVRLRETADRTIMWTVVPATVKVRDMEQEHGRGDQDRDAAAG